jgi:hypothetical protein
VEEEEEEEKEEGVALLRVSFKEESEGTDGIIEEKEDWEEGVEDEVEEEEEEAESSPVVFGVSLFLLKTFKEGKEEEFSWLLLLFLGLLVGLLFQS